jgi:hypothetical protein
MVTNYDLEGERHNLATDDAKRLAHDKLYSESDLALARSDFPRASQLTPSGLHDLTLAESAVAPSAAVGNDHGKSQVFDVAENSARSPMNPDDPNCKPVRLPNRTFSVVDEYGREVDEHGRPYCNRRVTDINGRFAPSESQPGYPSTIDDDNSIHVSRFIEATAGGALAVGVPAAGLNAGRAFLVGGLNSIGNSMIESIFPHLREIPMVFETPSEAAVVGLTRGGALGAAAAALVYGATHLYHAVAADPEFDPWSKLQM